MSVSLAIEGWADSTLWAESQIDVLGEPFVQIELLADEVGKLHGPAARRLDPLRAQSGDHLRAFRGLRHGVAQYRDDGGGRDGRRHQPEPANRLVVRISG